ncbi:MAG: transketolase family protein [Nitrospinota bacterium]
MSEKLALREYYGKTLLELGRENKDIVVLDADLSSSTKTATFAKEFPERFFNMGVAEQNMMGTAAGLAAGGKIPFASTFAIFATGRAWEQVRQSIAYPRANVKIVATHGGITVGPDGPSHHANEDLAIMRAIPEMTVVIPADAYETVAAIKAAAAFNGPVYIRLTREKFPVIYGENKIMEFGRADVLEKGTDATIIACGLMIHKALEAAEQLKKEGESVGVINMSTIKPIDREAIQKAARESGALVTAEEHSIIGGLGSAVAETASESDPVPVIRVGVRDCFATSGNSDELLQYYKLGTPDVIDAVRKAVSLKKSCVQKI